MSNLQGLQKTIGSMKNASYLSKEYRLVGGTLQKDAAAFIKDVEKKAMQQKKNIITIFAVISD